MDCTCILVLLCSLSLVICLVIILQFTLSCHLCSVKCWVLRILPSFLTIIFKVVNLRLLHYDIVSSLDFHNQWLEPWMLVQLPFYFYNYLLIINERLTS